MTEEDLHTVAVLSSRVQIPMRGFESALATRHPVQEQQNPDCRDSPGLRCNSVRQLGDAAEGLRK